MTPEMKKYIKNFTNFVVGDFRAVLEKHNATVDTCGISPKELRLLYDMWQGDLATKKQVKQIITERIKKFNQKQA